MEMKNKKKKDNEEEKKKEEKRKLESPLTAKLLSMEEVVALSMRAQDQQNLFEVIAAIKPT